MEAEIITRELEDTAKGAPLTNAEMDQNFINLRDRIEAALEEAKAEALVLAIALG
jgi:hypothetical protein